MNLIDNITYNSLLPKQKELADSIGFDVLIHLVKVCGGSSLYIPKQERIEMQERNARIKAEFDGGNYKELAQKYEVTEVWVRQIIAGKE